MPVALIKNVPEALRDARESGRGMVLPLEGKQGERIEVIGNPIRFLGEAERDATYPPRLGEDAQHVLEQWLRVSEADVSALVAQGVLVQRPAGSAHAPVATGAGKAVAP